MRGLRVGDVVAVEPSIFCGHRHYCRIGRGNRCENFDSFGVIGQSGDCAELVGVTARHAFVMPEGLPRSWGPLIEPVSCAIHGFDRLAPRIGDHVLIYGAGRIGLILCSLGVNQAAGSVSVVDREAAQLPGATAAGADHVALSAKELDRPEGGEIVIDATRSPAAQEDALRHVRRGGTFLVIGVADKDAMASFSPFRVYNDEPTIIGSMAPPHCFERARHRWRRHHRRREMRPAGRRTRHIA